MWESCVETEMIAKMQELVVIDFDYDAYHFVLKIEKLIKN